MIRRPPGSTLFPYPTLSPISALDGAYRFLRTVEHRLQLVHEQQVHTMPTDQGALDRLARVMGYRDTADATARDQLDRKSTRLNSSHANILCAVFLLKKKYSEF